jgi:hypothetical protein
MPVTRRKCHQAYQQDRRQDNGYKDNEGFLQVWRIPGLNAGDTFVEKSDSVNPGHSYPNSLCYRYWRRRPSSGLGLWKNSRSGSRSIHDHGNALLYNS